MFIKFRKISSISEDFPILSLDIAILISSGVYGSDIMPLQTTSVLNLDSFFLISVENCLCDGDLDISIMQLVIRLGLIFGGLGFEIRVCEGGTMLYGWNV